MTTKAFAPWLRAQKLRPDATGAFARVLLDLAQRPGARRTTIGDVLAAPLSYPSRRYIHSLARETGLDWRQQAAPAAQRKRHLSYIALEGGLHDRKHDGGRLSEAQVHDLLAALAAGWVDPAYGCTLPLAPRLTNPQALLRSAYWPSRRANVRPDAMNRRSSSCRPSTGCGRLRFTRPDGHGR